MLLLGLMSTNGLWLSLPPESYLHSICEQHLMCDEDHVNEECSV